MPENDLALLIAAARRAGEIAMGYVGKRFEVITKPQDNSPVTEADLAVNAMLDETLRAARPDYGWLSEESADSPARLTARRVFVIDPIDGTRSFVAGDDTWAHSLAVVQDGVPLAAVVYLPMKDQLYSAIQGGGAALNGAPITASDAHDLASARVLTTKPNLDPRHWRSAVPDLRRSHRPSVAYRLSLVAEGRYDAMFTFRPSWEWDIAAGALLVTEAGAVITDRSGAPLSFNAPHPQVSGVVAATPALHAEILARL
ncbi:MAG: 3'(2'),5'-bisphosphate nucleotidase CysQ [Roseivivax sp.]|nr:3'(2'),5'-bisphosphate nucleotidase CysQ [Roseivivax sp.]